MGVIVPAQYTSQVDAAAKALGIPAAVVAEQIATESEFNPRAVSPAGAEGIAQFEPGTFAQYGHGSPFDVNDAFAAYTNYMGTLLKQEGGDVRRALAAYNAGPGNLSAGYGYADHILSQAGAKNLHVPPGPGLGSEIGNIANTATGGLLQWPGEITGFFKDATDLVTGNVSWIKAFFQPSTYIRIGAGVFGTVFLILALVFLARQTKGT